MKVVELLSAVLNIGVALSINPIPFRVRNVCKTSVHEGPEPRIYGGEVAPEHKFPFMIFVLMRFGEGSCKQCTASLVKPNWVLLAAHCVNMTGLAPKDIILVGGRADLKDYVKERIKMDFYATINEEEFGVQERRAKAFFSHPDFDPNSFEHDVALIKVEAFDLGSVGTIPIAEDQIKSHKFCTILGWGFHPGDVQTFKLNYVEDKRVSTTKLKCAHKITGPFICLHPDNRGICQGDSGSPLVCDGKVWGVASHLLISDGRSDCGYALEEYYSEISEDFYWLRSVYDSGNLSSAISLRSVMICLFAGLWLSPKM